MGYRFGYGVCALTDGLSREIAAMFSETYYIWGISKSNKVGTHPLVLITFNHTAL